MGFFCKNDLARRIFVSLIYLLSLSLAPIERLTIYADSASKLKTTIKTCIPYLSTIGTVSAISLLLGPKILELRKQAELTSLVMREAEVTTSDREMLQTKLQSAGLYPKSPLYIRFLGQLHGRSELEGALNTKEVDEIVGSQFQILQFLAQDEITHIFVEGYFETISSYDVARAKDMNSPGISLAFKKDLIQILKAFPTGIPTRENELTERQKKLLYDHGAALIALVLGEVEVLVGVDRQFNSKQLVLQFFTMSSKAEARDVGANLFQNREVPAIFKILEYLKNNPEARQNIVLIFGQNHLFENYSDGNLQIERNQPRELLR